MIPPSAVCQALVHLPLKGNGFGMIRVCMEGQEQAILVLFCQKQFPLYLQIALSKNELFPLNHSYHLAIADFYIPEVRLSRFCFCASQQILVAKSVTRFTVENN